MKFNHIKIKLIASNQSQMLLTKVIESNDNQTYSTKVIDSKK
jgi:hypothetical protein